MITMPCPLKPHRVSYAPKLFDSITGEVNDSEKEV
jgi:hypothetical protein